VHLCILTRNLSSVVHRDVMFFLFYNCVSLFFSLFIPLALVLCPILMYEDILCFLQLAGKVPVGCQAWGPLQVFIIITEQCET